MRAVTILVASAVLAGACLPAQTKTAQISPMRQIYVQDQRDRGVSLADDGSPISPSANKGPVQSIDPASMVARDHARRAQVTDLIASGRITTAQDFHDAAFIFQHGDKPEHYLLAHVLAVEAIAKGDADARWIAAATLDRYLQSIGQPQIFGTQFVAKQWSYYLQHRNDADVLAKIKEIQYPNDMTQDPYDSALLSDGVRTVFCVSDLASQRQQVEDMNNNKPLTHTAPSGCSR